MGDRPTPVEYAVGLPETVKWLYHSEYYSDFTIKCGDTATFKVHKLVLHSRSAYFKGILNNANGNITEVEVSEDPRIFTAILRYIYGYDFDGHPPQDMFMAQYCIAVSMLAEKYEMPDLPSRAAILFKEACSDDNGDLRISPKKLVDALYSIHESGAPSDDQLWKFAGHIIQDNVGMLLADEEAGFVKACQDMPNLTAMLLSKLISRKDLYELMKMKHNPKNE
ncbi:hypothetical protein CB0940_08011 [Cercospora beticola]|nr:hypothetical protein CB0940_08011 [Cercospora beticola]PIA94756.1 hypothetical protein CB0940_08011 [Cercospora beticola]